jgi:hypothetical protein
MIGRFTVLPTIDGYEVIDSDTGRPVDHRDNPRSANGAAQYLNDAARQSDPRVLLNALVRGRASDPCDPDSIRAAFSDPVGTARRELSEGHSHRDQW